MSAVVRTFDAFAERYDTWFRGKQGSVIFPAEVDAVRILLRRLRPPFLEVGVGTGAFAQALGVRVGVDPALGALLLARARSVQVVQAVGEALPFSDGFFGGVLLISTLCFVERPLRVLREAARVTKAGGGVLVADVVKDSAWGQFYLRKKAEGHVFYRHATFYSMDDLRHVLREARLGVMASSSALFEPPAAHVKTEGAAEGVAPGASFVSLLAMREESGA